MEYIKKYISLIVVGLIIVGCFALYYKKKKYDEQISELNNLVAQQSKTIEIKSDLYEKVTVEISNLNGSLDAMLKNIQGLTESLLAMKKIIDKKNEEILSANQLILKWKKAYEAEAAANQEDVPGDGDEIRKKVSFTKDFGYIGVSGYTLTDPAYAYVKVEQLRPLALTVAITQSKDKKWHTYVSSSEENIGVDIAVSSVNPFINRKKWYQKISLDAGVSVLDTAAPYVGTSYRFDNGMFGTIGYWASQEKTGMYFNIGYSFYPFK